MKIQVKNGKLMLRRGKPVVMTYLPWFTESCCEAKTLKGMTLNGRYGPYCITFTEWQGPGKVCPAFSCWRIYELYDNFHIQSGLINEQGQMVNLPSQYCSGFQYNGYVILRVYCRNCETGACP